jgi:hypothetical protein
MGSGVTGDDGIFECGEGSASSNAGNGFKAWIGALCSMVEEGAVDDVRRDDEHKELEVYEFIVA